MSKTLGQIAEEIAMAGLFTPERWDKAAQAVADHVRGECAEKTVQLRVLNDHLSFENSRMRLQIEQLENERRGLAEFGRIKSTPYACCTDDTSSDGTDNAHPAWWRGHDSGVNSTILRIANMLDGIDDGVGVASDKQYQAMRTRIIELAKQSKTPQFKFKVGDIGWAILSDGVGLMKRTVSEVKAVYVVKGHDPYDDSKLLTGQEVSEWVKVKGEK